MDAVSVRMAGRNWQVNSASQRYCTEHASTVLLRIVHECLERSDCRGRARVKGARQKAKRRVNCVVAVGVALCVVAVAFVVALHHQGGKEPERNQRRTIVRIEPFPNGTNNWTKRGETQLNRMQLNQNWMEPTWKWHSLLNVLCVWQHWQLFLIEIDSDCELVLISSRLRYI